MGFTRPVINGKVAVVINFLSFQCGWFLETEHRGEIIPLIVPSVLFGIPLGTIMIRWMDPESFRRICMAFDALVVGFGLSRVLVELDLASTETTYAIMCIVLLVNGILLFRFFQERPPP